MAAMWTFFSRARDMFGTVQQVGRKAFRNNESYMVYELLKDRGKMDDSSETLLDVSVANELKRQCNELMTMQHEQILKKPRLAPLMCRDEKVEAGADAIREMMDAVATLKARVQQRMGFTISRKQSTVDGAGFGLFLHGCVDPGDVVAFIPGIIYEVDEIQEHPGYPQFAENDNMQLCARLDGTLIDTDDAVAQRLILGSEYSGPPPCPFWELRNIYASGHFANHPPPGKRDNVVSQMVDFDMTELQRLRLKSFIPYYRPNISKNVFKRFVVKDNPSRLRGLVLVARETIREGDEIFRNYRINPFLPVIPKWFVDPDPEGTKLRWGS
mmetsp:Transcript_10914/g.33465  ORF Transcript_10914/g.33465 Transcript_10914/m.33465 type:complete len:327 (-) Transcript_10914:1102-2082(-)